MKIISFGTLKGGVGKTLTCFTLAGILAESKPKKKVLVIDADFQSNITNDFGLNAAEINYSTNNMFENVKPINEIIIESPIEELPNLSLIPGSIFLERQNMSLINVTSRENVLKKYFAKYEKEFDYDYVLFDVHPNMSLVNINCFNISDSIVLITDVSFNGLQGAELFSDMWLSHADDLAINSNIKALIVNQTDARLKITEEFLEQIQNHKEFGKFFVGSIPTNSKLKESELDAKPVNLTNKKSAGYIAFEQIFKNLSKKGVF